MNSSALLRRSISIPSRAPVAAATISPATDLAWRILVVAGAALAVIGWTDVVLLWTPINFGVAEWEFGVIAQSLQAMPLGTVGLVLVITGAVARGSRFIPALLVPVFLSVTAAVLALFGMFILASLEGLGSIAPEMQPTMGKAVLKSSVLAVTYLLFYTWMSVISIRSARRKGPANE